MATRVSLASIARISVGIVAIVWAVLGLGDALAAGMGRGADAIVVAAVIVNSLLIASAVLAFAKAHYWRAIMIAVTVGVTAVRIVQVLGTGDWWLAASSVAMLVAITGISSVARTP